MEIRRSVSSAAMVEAAVTEVTAMAKITAVAKVTVGEITVMEPVVTEVSAVRSEFVMVEEGSTATPVVPPVTPAPPKSSEEADSKSNTEGQSDAAPKDPGHRVPARVRNNWPTIYDPRIIGRHVHHL